LLSIHGAKNTDTVNIIVWDILDHFLDFLFNKIHEYSFGEERV